MRAAFRGASTSQRSESHYALLTSWVGTTCRCGHTADTERNYAAKTAQLPAISGGFRPGLGIPLVLRIPVFLGRPDRADGRKKQTDLAEEFTFPVASGVVAGGSLMGVALVLWLNGGSILGKLFGG